MPDILGFALSSLSAFALSYTCFWFTHRHFEDSKQKAWIVTLLSSTVMATGSLPFLWRYLRAHGDVLLVPNFDWLSQTLCAAFQGFLLSDLALGSQFYAQHLTPALGWGHHLAYAVILPYITYRGWARVFALCLAMEIPTCMLAASFLFPKLRNDMLFALLFFATRVVFHISLFVAYVKPRGRTGGVDGSYIPALLLATALLMHLSWFINSVFGILRHRTQARIVNPTKYVTETVSETSIESNVQPGKRQQIQLSSIVGRSNLKTMPSMYQALQSGDSRIQSSEVFPLFSLQYESL